MEPTSVIYLPNILPSDINNLIVFALIALLVLWSVRIFRNSCQLLELSRSITLQAIFRLDIPNESTLSPRDYFEQLLRRRQQAKSPPSSVQYVLNPINIDKSSIQLIPTNPEKLEEETMGRYSLKFNFDSVYPCNIRLYWGVQRSELDRKLFGESALKKLRDGEDQPNDEEETEEGTQEVTDETTEEKEEEEEGLLKEQNKGKKRTSAWIEMLSAPFSSLIRSTHLTKEDSVDDDLEANTSGLLSASGNRAEEFDKKRSSLVESCYASSPLMVFEAGMKQAFETPINAQLVVAKQDQLSFTFDPSTSEVYPLLIELSLSSGTVNSTQSQQPLKVINSQYTMAHFTKATEEPETYRTAIINQFFDGKQDADKTESEDVSKAGDSLSASRYPSLCEYKDIYGIYDSEPDCVVCLCEPKAATILPCRHFCVCFSCMLKLEKCPVCRTKIKSYMRFSHQNEEHEL